jgi:pyruvate kinase
MHANVHPEVEEELERVAMELADLRAAMGAEEYARADAIARVAPGRRASARNLAHYLALRHRDMRALQGRLAELGLSSLGRSEAHAAATVEAVQRAVARMRGTPEPVARAPVGIRDGSALLAARATELLGASRARRPTRIMVTLPSDAADDPELVREMVAAGMDCARINTAHDDGEAWGRMASHVRAAAADLRRRCLVHVDLAGPKLRTGAIAAVGDAKPRITLHRGDHLRVTADQTPGSAGTDDPDAGIVQPARVPCTLPAVLGQVRVGESVWFDDGAIGGVVEEASPHELGVVITHARAKGSRLRAGKGINLPDSTLEVPALGPGDLAALPFAARSADLVGLSFAQSAADVRDLRERLVGLGAEQASIVLKVETARGFEALPEMLLAALESGPLGVMIARGDLAVEVGYERLAEVQLEILWLCEAAHVPSIWATQVLETLAHDGQPTRAEVTDAATGVRAECVMLNKGPEIVATIAALDDILGRMARHQVKKTPLLRELRAWRREEHGAVR